jgi:MFS family permease
MSTDQRFFLIPTFVTLAICAAEVGISFNSVLLPNIQDNFQVSEAIAQSSVSIGLFALGFFGIIYGAISDILGRKPMFLIAIGLFSLASLLCASANTLGTFLIAKFIQGAGSGASWIVGNATLKDIFHGKDYVNIMNKIHAIAGITPAIDRRFNCSALLMATCLLCPCRIWLHLLDRNGLISTRNAKNKKTIFHTAYHE